MCNRKKWLTGLLGAVMCLALAAVNKQDVEAGQQNYVIGSYIVCTEDTDLFVLPDCNEGKVAPIPKNAVAVIVALIIKLTPNVANIVDNALAAQRGGADAVSLINTVVAMAVDFKRRKPVLAAKSGGLSGPCVKPIALRMVHECYKALDIPIIGMGGIMTGTDVGEFMLCGAAAVEVGTANIFDPYAGERIVNELTKLCECDNITDVSSIIGGLKVE